MEAVSNVNSHQTDKKGEISHHAGKAEKKKDIGTEPWSTPMGYNDTQNRVYPKNQGQAFRGGKNNQLETPAVHGD